jgi:hypothetical protein
LDRLAVDAVDLVPLNGEPDTVAEVRFTLRSGRTVSLVGCPIDGSADTSANPTRAFCDQEWPLGGERAT